MDLRILYIFLSLLVVTYQTEFQHALKQYLATCGPLRLCSLESVQISHINVTSTGACPSCECEKSCISRGTCCPDFLFSKPKQKCVPVMIYGVKNDSKSYFMNGDRQNLKSNNYEDFLVNILNIPVTSLESFVTYIDERTAKVLDPSYSKDNVVKWGLKFDCNTFTDFNFISSYVELLSVMQNHVCTVSYTPTQKLSSITRECGPSKPNTINHCNETGSWENYDSGVEWACSNHQHNSGFFQNVFCRICNPTPTTDEVISVCNVTGKWSYFDRDLETACKTQPFSEVTYPFKNLFCKACNQRYKTVSLFQEVTGTVHESITDHANASVTQKSFQYLINITGFSSVVKKNLISIASSLTVENKEDMMWRDNMWINRTKLVIQYQAVTGTGSCADFRLSRPPCSCEASCLYNPYITCCIDFLLDYYEFHNENVYKFTSVYINQPSSLYSTISSCKYNNAFLAKCRNGTNEIIDMLPVTEVSTELHFRNVYCFLCNRINISNMNSVLEDVRPWNIKLNSGSIMPIYFFTSLTELIQHPKFNNTVISLEPRATPWPERKYISNSKINSCNTTRTLTIIDNDILWACTSNSLKELPTDVLYTNSFCKICNPGIMRPSFYKDCNKTGRWDVLNNEIRYACRSYPEIASSFPNKNEFCAICNRKETTTPTMTPISSTKPHVPFSTLAGDPGAAFRDLFSGLVDPPEEKSVTCDSSYWKDPNGKCRKLQCFPGKLLKDIECVPLFRITRHLNYTMYLSANITTGNDTWRKNGDKYTSKFVENTVGEIFSKIIEIFNTTCISRQEVFFKLESIGFESILVDMKISFFVRDFVDRYMSERLLVSFSNDSFEDKTLSGYSLKNIIEYQRRNAVDASDMRIINQIPKCEENMAPLKDYEIYRNIFVSRSLLCPQVKLLENEVDVLKENKIRVRIGRYDKILRYFEYYQSENGSYLVCVEDLKSSSSSTSQDEDQALRIFTLVCTSISLIFLILTFIHFCIFKSTRTLPGLSTMSLIVSLFFAMLFLQVFLRNTNNQNDAGCKVTAVMIHFWWLAVFCWYSVMGSSMFMLFFRGTSRINDNERLSLFLKYSLFSYGFSVLLILLTIVGNSAASGDIGYGSEKICFLNNSLSLVLSFLVPVSSVCFLNLIFFITVIYRLRFRSGVMTQNNNDINMYFVYLKLFSVTGLSWILFLIDAAIPYTTVFSYFATFINGLQGVFMFWFHVANEKSRKNYYSFRESLKKKRPNQPFSSTKRSSKYIASSSKTYRSGSTDTSHSIISSSENMCNSVADSDV